jgi:hypothetical protein
VSARGEVISLAAARRCRSIVERIRSRPQAEVRGGLVVTLACDQDNAHTPAGARAYANRLLALADFAEGVPTPPTLTNAEVRARLALLGDAVARLDNGVGGVSSVMALVRQLTAEVRR